MSCAIKLVAAIQDIPGIRRWLYPTDDLRGGDAWLQCCQISVCPTGEIIAISYEKRLAILSAKWDPASSLNNFQSTFSGIARENESITALLCVPLVGQSQRSHVGPDWTCTVVGFETGYLRFYTETGVLLFEEQLHDESVVSLKCQSHHSPRPDINSELFQEEIHVQYSNSICIINGSSIFPILWNCRSQLALVGARGDTFKCPEISVNPKKWGLQDQSYVKDASIVGLDLSNTFDHLEIASNSGGFDTKYRAMAPHHSLVLTAGTRPFVGFHYALEGGSQPVLSDVAKAVANKLKSALPVWLTRGKTPVENQNSTVTLPPEPTHCRFGLTDLRRTAVNIILSPNKKLAFVSDTLGRVLLIDTHKGIAIKIFKGYRDVQCSFLQVADERKSKHHGGRKIALFLVIYSPKRGTIEVFGAQMGTKVATFAASKYSRLVYVSYGLLGFTAATKTRYVCQFTCVLIDNDGKVKEVVVPFHFSLSERNSKRIRDIYLYKQLKQFIKSNEESNSDELTNVVLNTCMEMKCTDVKVQCLDLLVNAKHIPADVVVLAAKCFSEKTNETDHELKQLINKAEKIILLINFYSFLKQTNVNDGEKQQNESFGLTIREKEIENLQKLLDLSAHRDESVSGDYKVSFYDTNKSDLSEFLSIFNLNEPTISLKADADLNSIFKASETIFKRYIIETESDYELTKSEFQKSTIMIKDLFRMLLYFWVNVHGLVDVDKEMTNLSRIMYALVQIMDRNDAVVDYNSKSEFWSEIRNLLNDSPKPFPALTAAIACRTVCQRAVQDFEIQTTDETSAELWETLSQENCEWTILMGKLEDVSLLNIILGTKLADRGGSALKLKHDVKDVSLRFILETGRGSVSELVARWLTTVGVAPEDVVANEIADCDDQREQQPLLLVPSTRPILNSIQQQVFVYLNLIRKEFPYSADANVLLANMCWEYMLFWQKQIDQLEYLEAALRCLRNISEHNIKRGLYVLIWSTHVKFNFESCAKLINKVGKLPKSRLCEQDTRFSDCKMVNFLEICTDFLDEFMEVIQNCFGTHKKPLQYEPIWETSVGGSVPLVELALQQTETNYDLVVLHHQLSLALLMMATFEIKHNKPISNLFDGSLTCLFFTDIQKNLKVSWNKSHGKVNNSQLQFLFKVISASVDSITMNGDVVFSSKHVHWMSKCLLLARLWNLDPDLLKRFQIVELFSSGWDSLALELLPSVSDCKALGPPLLAVAGRRLKHFMAQSRDLGETISALSPTLTNYLDSLNEEWSASNKLEDIATIATHCLLYLSEDQLEFTLAALLQEACQTLKDLPS